MAGILNENEFGMLPLLLVLETQEVFTTLGWYMFPDLSNREWLHISGGVLFVTFLCPAMSFYALLHLPLAVSMTLNSLGPLYSLLILFILNTMRRHKSSTDENAETESKKIQETDSITRRAVCGTILACCGVVPFYMA